MANHDSLEWSKQYVVLGISRLYLNALRFSVEEINLLTDEDMQAIADDLRNGLEIAFDEDVIAAVYDVLTSKGEPEPYYDNLIRQSFEGNQDTPPTT